MIYHKTLESEKLILRALEPEDIDLLYTWENMSEYWAMGSTIAPFSKYILRKYIENSHLDIYEAKQLRLMIQEKETNTTVGSIDLYDFDPQNKRSGVGIFVHPDYTQNGYATQALELLQKYAGDVLGLHQIYSEIAISNEASIALFKKAGFKETGLKKDWVRIGNEFFDQITLQFIFTNH